jgi:phosphatidylglycerophosphate synthase
VTGPDVSSALRIGLALLLAWAATLPFTVGPAVMLFAFIVGVGTDVAGLLLARGTRASRGHILDSLADKALVYAVLVPLALRGFPPVFLLLPLLARDALAVALQVVAARRGVALPVGGSGAAKAALLYVACAAPLTLEWMQSGTAPVTVGAGDLGTILPFLGIFLLSLVVGTLLSLVTLSRYVLMLRSSGS